MLDFLRRIWAFVLRIFAGKQDDVESTTPTRRKKRAVIVGINRYEEPGNDLDGCVNDVKDILSLLMERGFKREDIRLLENDQATKTAIQRALQDMVSETRAEDEAVYYHSGHGSRVKDLSGDETFDRPDECVVTYDHDWLSPLIDDNLKSIFRELPEGAFLTVIIDTCHSGTMTDLSPISGESEPTGTVYLENLKKRYLPPPLDLAPTKDGILRRYGAKPGDESGQRHVLISGCRDDEYSLEKVIDGKTRGLLTYHLTKAIRKNPEMIVREIYGVVYHEICQNQHPQLMGMEKLKIRLPFGG